MKDKPEAGRYRHAVDSGATHDKVAAADPAAAPLHTDAEAAGTHTSARELERTARDQQGQQIPVPGQSGAWWLAGALAVSAALSLAIAYWLLP